MDPEPVAVPLLLYDGDCAFCIAWIRYWKELTGDRIAYASFNEAADRFPDLSRQSVHLVMPDGETFSAAQAVYKTLALAGGKTWLLWAYENVPGFAFASEGSYRLIAAHRSFFFHLTRLLFGGELHRLEYNAVQWLFLRALGLIYFSAFASFGVQILGLIGSKGILPVSVYLPRAHEYFGTSAFWTIPTIFWFNCCDDALRWACIAGAILAALIFFGIFEQFALVAAFLLWLSLATAGQDFMSFQWDMLLLEAGFLAIFLRYSRVIIYLFRWLLFRLMFLSGAVKLLSGDPSWRGLSAVGFHYRTQPIPTPLAWYMYQLPGWFQRTSTALMFLVELAMPLLIFAPRRARHLAAWCIVGLQLLIMLTGNYAFFNWLALAFCLFLFDDRALARILPERLLAAARRPRRIWLPLSMRRALVGVLALLILAISASQMLQSFFRWTPPPARSLLVLVAPFGIANSYGLFAVMTTLRPEIIVEGSTDGSTWQAYEFKYKAGDLHRRLPWVAPHQPRLDWQMWFAALGNYRQNPWFLNFMARILEGSPDVLRLLDRNPFPQAPPRFVRAILYEYRFTDAATRRQTGAVWTRELLGSYLPAISLSDLKTSTQ